MNFYNKKKRLFWSLVLLCTSIAGFSQTAPVPKFHDTEGAIVVDGRGQLEYTLPISLPPGIKNIAPEINLTYSSNAGNGIAGQGWNITGISSISRLGKTIEKDGEQKAVQLDYSDYYSFNGQKLILKSGEYGKDGAEYVTEKYSNVKIKSLGNQSNWKQPEYWEVTFEDGSQAWYGNTTAGWNDAANRLNFNIVKWKDINGNIIHYNYEQQENVSIIKSITWGGNEPLGKNDFNEIIFNYTERNNFETAFVNGPGTLFTQKKILQNIIVKTNGNLFNKYVVEYTTDAGGYQYVKNITEHNSNDEPSNSAEFTYSPQKPTEISGWNMDSQALFDKLKLTGDFNGDAYLDFIMTDGTIKLGAFNDTFNVVQTNKTFNSNSLVVNSLLDETGRVYNGNGVIEYENNKVSGYIFRDNTFVKVFEKVFQEPCTSCIYQATSINEGDIDGDGISDIFLTATSGGFVYRYIIDLKNASTPYSTYSTNNTFNEGAYTNQKYLDIDGDGKVEIINISNTAYTVFEFVKTAPNQYQKKIKFSANLDEAKGDEFPVLLGDFNGDGKLDFSIPIAEKNVGLADWRFYIGTGQSFYSIYKPDFLVYKSESAQNNGAWLRFSRTNYSVTDLNADGKSDIVQVFSYSNKLTENARTVGVTVNSMISKGAMASGALLNFELKNIYTYPAPGTYNIHTPVDDLAIYQPLTNVIRSNNNYYNVFLFRKDNILKIKAPTGVDELKRIQSISQGGVTTFVKYLELIPDNTNNSNFYKKSNNELYPYYSLNRIDKGYAVSQLEQEGRKQDFRYRGMTGHLQGKGIMGYHQTARSSWYADGLENTKIWSGIEIDPLQEGLPVKEWGIRTNTESKIFPTDISVNNNELLSFKSTVYQTDKLLNGQVVTSVAEADKPKVVTAIKPKSTTAKDFLTSTISTAEITYGDYYLPAQSITNVNNGYAIMTSNYLYNNNASGTGVNYYIGLPASKIDVTQAYGDTKSSKEEYFYENNRLKTVKTWNRDNTEYTLETYSYDGFGNIIEKVINNSVDSQIQSAKSQYDYKGRFVEKKTDNLGLETGIIYNDWGQVLTKTDPWGNTLTNTYDHWGKLLTSTTSTEGTTTYTYEKDIHSNTTVSQYDADGNISKVFTNKLGQEYKTTTKAFAQGQFVSKDIQYDILGRKLKESEPYFDGQSPNQWNTFSYDNSVFPAKVTATSFNGKVMETSISGLTTTVKEINGYARTTSTTTDALGNVISSTDKGGTVGFSYNAAGEQIQAKYAENIVKTLYDSWGRKSEFNDPSNGIYKYEYNGFGQAKKTISPKGTKEYTYNILGQLVSQTEISTIDGGQATNKNISFTYDDKGSLITKSGTVSGESIRTNFIYDSQGRLSSSVENGYGIRYTQNGIVYDNKGRITSYDKQLRSEGVITKVQVENVYSDWNGELSQVKDKLTGKVLWELQETNAKGLVLRAKLGEVNVNNTYDPNGYLAYVNQSSAVKPNLLRLSYVFDALKNELKSRTTEGDFTITESFDYDDNNRLIKWTDPALGFATNSNVYDIKGRIKENDQVGTIKFENSAKIYQPTGMTLNAAGVQNYQNDLIQSIVYNENNDPVFIDGEKGDVAFKYGLSGMRQKVTYGGNFSTDGSGMFTKFYSEDGSFEVIKDNATGKEKHLIYIGGTPYESNIVYLKGYTESSGSYKFLHKDYLGSILAISDEAGNKLEQRHFDAWGNLTHLQIGDGKISVGKKSIIYTIGSFGGLIVDRGYTGHEHFLEVGIIHMNGRLYDPLLRRFLNADENIQDPFYTQNYNKYGYVFNNPLMYADPDGEFVFIIIGAVAGAYLTGVKANGSWNPTKWNWSATWGKIAMGAAVGAFTGGVGAAAGAAAAGYAAATWGISGGILGGAIAGGAGGLVAGAISGFSTAAMFGENIIEGTLKGAASGLVMGGVLGGVAGGIQQAIANAGAAKAGLPINNMWTNKPVGAGRSTWALNNTPKTTTVGATPKVGASGIKYNIRVGEADGEYQTGTSIVDEQAGAPIYKSDNKLANLDQAEVTATKVGKSTVQANRAAGNAFRDELADALRAEGRAVRTEVYKRTPYGKRYMDIEVKMPNGKSAGIETKVGGSRYHTLQRLKDDWLRANGYPVQVVRKK